jgi:hypothetical protein
VEELVTGEPPEGISPEALRLAHDYDGLDDEGRRSIEVSMEGLRATHRRVEPQTPERMAE